MTHYLVSLGNDTFQFQPIDSAAAGRGRELFHSVGCVACHSPRNEDGVARFPDGSVPLGKLPQKYNLQGLAAFLENPHAEGADDTVYYSNDAVVPRVGTPLTVVFYPSEGSDE